MSFLRGHKLVRDDLWVRGSRIIDPQERFWEASSTHAFAADRIVDGAGMILAPGYIDLQLNGAFGFDFSNPADMAPCTPEQQARGETDKITQICRGVLAHGVTSLYATVITSSPQTYAQLRPLVKRRAGSAKDGAHILGVHLEGPFITVAGAHPPPLIRGHYAPSNETTLAPDALSPSPLPPAAPASASSSSPSPPAAQLHDFAEVCSVYGADSLSSGDVGIITLAPEIPGMSEVIRVLSAPPYNIVISAGHSKATFDEALRAVGLGTRLITHLFNAMVSFHHRDPGLIGLLGTKEAAAKPLSDGAAASALLAEAVKDQSVRGSHMAVTPVAARDHTSPPPPSLFYSLIVDGHHTHPSSVKIAYSTHPTGAILITDAILAMGLSDGAYRFGEIAVEIAAHMAHVSGTNTLAGSIATMEQCVQNFLQFTGCSVVEAIEAATLHPAQCMRLPNKGSLDVGCDADLILLDDKLNVQAVWVMGEKAFMKENTGIRITEVGAQAKA